jgi:hypothetical protein
MATAASDQKAADFYTFFNPKLRDNSYAAGDVYSKDTVADAQSEWEIDR